MQDWTSGYIADIGYTFGYYPELNPLRARLAFLNVGLVPPEQGVHCELGYGQGLSANIHAAAGACAWYATDFNPTHAGFAQAMARSFSADAHLTDQAFIDFCAREDLPDFDSIGLHGIWSWVADDDRRVIVDFIRRKLKIGGVVYISYNTQPGWSAIAPVRDLLNEHSQVMSAPGQGIITQVEAALDFADKLFATKPNYLKANPLVAERFNALKNQNKNYLAHEYFNRTWLPMPFSKMVDWLSSAKVSYACSANYIEHIDAVNFTDEQQSLLKMIPDAMFRETVRDFMVNQQFRKDYWVKGARNINGPEQIELFRALTVMLISPRAEVSLKIGTPVGEATMQPAVYNPILDLLADHIPKTLKQIEQDVAASGITLVQVTQAVMVLAGLGHLAEVQPQATIASALPSTQKLNTYIIDKAKHSNDIGYLASPMIGGGVRLSRVEQLFLLALSEGKTQPNEWAQRVLQIMSEQNQKIIKNGVTLETPDENMAELIAQALIFADKKWPILTALKIA